MDKRLLKKIAKDWAKGILIATAMDEDELDDVLNEDEQMYIVEEVKNIADRITSDTAITNLVEIVGKYYKIE